MWMAVWTMAAVALVGGAVLAEQAGEDGAAMRRSVQAVRCAPTEGALVLSLVRAGRLPVLEADTTAGSVMFFMDGRGNWSLVVAEPGRAERCVLLEGGRLRALMSGTLGMPIDR